MSRKFAIGEIAEHVGYRDFKRGELVEIVATGPLTHSIVSGKFIEDGPSDYAIKSLDDGCIGHVAECRLRKRRPPQDNLFTEWFKSHIITDPICVPSLEETMKRTQANLQQFADLKPVERIDTTSREEGNGG